MAMLVDPLLSELLQLVIDAAKTTANFKPQLTQLKETLDRINPTIVRIQDLNRQLGQTDERIDQFFTIIQEASDLVRQCLKIRKYAILRRYTHSLKLEDVERRLSWFFQTELQADQSVDIKTLLVRINNITLAMKKGFLPVPSVKENLVSRVPPVTRGIVGLYKPLQKLKATILDDDSSSMYHRDHFDGGSVVVVTGPGGSGKTTLVTLLCNDHAIRAKFGEYVFFVSVSQTPDFIKIVDDLFNINSLSQQDPCKSKEDAMISLENFLHQKSDPILLVLDDVWSDSFIESFAFKIKGYKILVTSRMDFQKYNAFHVDPLSDEDAEALLRIKAFTGDSRDGPAIGEDLVKQMAKTCGNYPLAISVVGKALNGKDESFWRDALNSLQDAYTSKTLDQILMLSFQSLDDKLKHCYLDLGVVGEDQKIMTGALLNMWVHLYGHDDDGSETHNMIMKLSTLNLVILAGPDEEDSGAIDDNHEQPYVRLHDLLRDFIMGLNSKLPIAQRTRLNIDAYEHLPASIEQVKEPMQARMLSISTGDKFSSRWCDMKVPKVEVMVLNFQSETYTLPHFMKGMPKLNILNVTNWGEYPTVHLDLDLLGSLSNMTRLWLERVEISSLTESTLALANLQKVSFIKCIIGNAFENLNSNGFNIWPKLVEIEMDRCQDLVGFPGILCSIVRLKKLSITNCNEMYGLSERFGNLVNLETLNLRSCKKLEKLPASVTRLQKLRSIDISYCVGLSELPEQMGKLGSLQTIHMKGCTGVHELPLSLKELSHTKVVCDKDISYLWQKFPNVVEV